MKARLFFLILFSPCCWLFAQNKQLFTVEQFVQQIKQYHPLVKLANVQIRKSEAELLVARSAFDPTFAYEASQKTFDGKNYYYYQNPELKVPLPIGDIKTGTENNGGINLSSENTDGRSSYLGVELPLAKGLLIDKRRAVLQQAKLYTQQTQQERNQAINEVLFDAYVAYWQWAGWYQLQAVYARYLQNSIDRFNLIKLGAKNGDRSGIDTLEAYTQMQNILVMQIDATAKLNASQVELSNFLWQSNDSAYVLPQTFVPDTIQFAIMPQPVTTNELVQQALSINPTLRGYDFKLQQLQVERKLKFQSLLPTVNVSANLLSKDYYAFKSSYNPYLENNNKFGLFVKMPLFVREGRGEYKKAQLKIQETNFAIMQKRWEIQNKIKNYHIEYSQLQQQLQLTQSMYTNYSQLLKNEVLRFNNGESSLFLINSRENKALETLQKTIELKIKLYKAKYAMEWAAGLLQ